jgi:hypothetical protein
MSQRITGVNAADRPYFSFFARTRRAEAGQAIGGVRCLEWQAKTNRQRYGLIPVGGQWQLAHRWAYATFRNAIPRGMCVLHKCDNPSCVEVAHLFIGTNQDNIRDRDAKGRGPVGTRNPMSKLDEATVLEIRKSYATGAYSQARLASERGVSRELIREIVHGRIWASVHGPLTQRAG